MPPQVRLSSPLDHTAAPVAVAPAAKASAQPAEVADAANAGIRPEPELPEYEAIAPETPPRLPAS